MDVPEAFFTRDSILTFAGASTAVWILANAANKLFKRTSILAVFLIALVVAGIGAYEARTLTSVVGVFLMLLNACLLFFTAAGAQESISAAGQKRPRGETEVHGAERPSWSASWFG